MTRDHTDAMVVTVVEARPVAIRLSNVERIRHYFDVTPDTLRQWNEEGWFPIRWKGRGPGRRGIVVLNEAERALQGLTEDRKRVDP